MGGAQGQLQGSPQGGGELSSAPEAPDQGEGSRGSHITRATQTAEDGRGPSGDSWAPGDGSPGPPPPAHRPGEGLGSQD